MQENTQPYYFRAEPRALSSKSFPKNDMQTINIQVYKNLMFERKIIRGNTNSMNFKKNHAENKSRNVLRNKDRYVTINQGDKKSFGKKSNSDLNRLSGIRGNKTRASCYVDHTDRLSTNLPAFFDISTQTELLIEKSLPDLRYEFDYGIDKSIQIKEDELFNFDKEVEPLVITLTNRILDESHKEVMKEIEETKLIDIQQNIRNKSTVKNNLLKSFLEKEKEKLEGSRKIYAQYENNHLEAIKVNKKLIAREYSKQFLVKIQEEFEEKYRTFQNIENENVMKLADKLRPSIEKEIVKKIQRKNVIKNQLTNIFAHIDALNMNKHHETLLLHDRHEEIRKFHLLFPFKHLTNYKI